MVESSLEPALSDYIFNHASLLAFVTGPDGTILKAGTFAEKLLGNNLVGAVLSDFFVDFSTSFDLKSALKSEQSRLITVSVKNGLPQTFSFRFVDCGKKIFVTGELTHRDNESLRSHLIQLNGEVSNLNRELQKKTVELEKLNQLKNRFIGITAHDLRNPIGAIHGFSGALGREARDAGNAEHEEIFKAMHESTGFMLSLIEDLLTVVKIDSGEVKLNLEKADLSLEVASSLRLNKVFAENKEIRLDLDQRGELPEIALDRMKIQQVMNNLISNAVKFSARGTAVTVTVARKESDALVSIKDQGPGIAAAELDALFKPFSRTSVVATGGEPSTGLGLSIVKKIIEEHHGTIWVQSEVGTGTAFSFTLPLTTGSEETDDQE
jgi:signal transduction histidine kinase